MKKLLIAGLVIFSACSKSVDTLAPETNPVDKQTCNFGLTEFNLVKRPPVTNEYSKGKPPRNNTTTTVSPNASVLLLDFNGHVVSGTSWNSNGDFTCSPAALTTAEIDVVVERVRNDYSPFNINVTTDESIYNAASSVKRTRVVITDSWEWFGQAGGVGFVNSFTWGNNTPCFVFSSLLNYNVKQISEAVSHEAGHTLGLYHQSSYDASCIKLSDYNYGIGVGEIGWAPIMGVGYYKNFTIWHN